jgi:alpha-N-acetylglucosamine transferase
LDLTVACVFKPGNGFTEDYVRRLRAGVAKFCVAPHEFVCIGLDVPLKFKRPGYWNKLELFTKGLFRGPVVYLDLDCIIRKDVTDIFTYPHEFTALDNWKHPSRINSSFMAWNADEDLSYILTAYGPGLHSMDAIYEIEGDQGFIQDLLRKPVTRLSTLFPERVISYKLHVKPNNRVADTASIVMFHGRPRPADIGWRLP